MRAFLFLVFNLLISQPAFAQSKEEVQGFVDQQPEFPGDVRRFLGDQVRYPRFAVQNGIEGRVLVRFIVLETGEIDGIWVQKSVHSTLDSEAVRVVRSMPRWKAARIKGKEVKSYFTLPIKFTATEPGEQPRLDTANAQFYGLRALEFDRFPDLPRNRLYSLPALRIPQASVPANTALPRGASLLVTVSADGTVRDLRILTPMAEGLRTIVAQQATQFWTSPANPLHTAFTPASKEGTPKDCDLVLTFPLQSTL